MEAKDVRMVLAEYDLSVTDFAARVGVSLTYMSQLLHESTPLAPMEARLAQAISELKRNPPPRSFARRKPRG